MKRMYKKLYFYFEITNNILKIGPVTMKFTKIAVLVALIASGVKASRTIASDDDVSSPIVVSKVSKNMVRMIHKLYILVQ